jgi:hypothetical protein
MAQVKIGIIQNFTAFLSVCLPETRMMYIQQLDEVMAFENGNNWRLRSLIALYAAGRLEECTICRFAGVGCTDYVCRDSRRCKLTCIS